MSYTAGELAKLLSITKDTLRYYEKEGLFPPIERDAAGRRVYSEADREWIFLIRCLRDTDMPMGKIKQYVGLLKQGGGGVDPETAAASAGAPGVFKGENPRVSTFAGADGYQNRLL